MKQCFHYFETVNKRGNQDEPFIFAVSLRKHLSHSCSVCEDDHELTPPGALHHITARGIEKGRKHWGFGTRGRNGIESAREAFYVIGQYRVLT
jgi:hypothetical protein